MISNGFDEWYERTYPNSSSEVLIATSRAYTAAYDLQQEQIAKLEAELDEWRHGERMYPPAKQSYNDMLEHMNNKVADIAVERDALKELVMTLKDALKEAK